MDTTVSNLGHNQPPPDTLTDRLTNDHSSLLNRTEDLIEAAKRAPEQIETEAEAGKTADFIKQLQACVKNADAARVEEKEPYLEGGRRVDGFFKTRVIEPITEAKNAIQARLTAYQRKKAAEEAAKAEKVADENAADMSRSRGEHGGVASLRTVWKHRDLDRATLDLEALREHLPAAALDQAVRSFIKAGGRELKGVVIFEDTETVVR